MIAAELLAKQLEGTDTARAMRVLHITSGLGAGGAERSLLQLVRACEESQPIAEPQSKPGCRSDVVSMQVASLTAADALAGQFASSPAVFDLKAGWLNALNRLVAHARSYQPDLIHGWMYHGNLVASYVGWRLGVPVIWSIRHSLEQPEAETRGVRLVVGLGRRACFQPERVVYNSFSGWSTHVRSGYGAKPSMIIPNGVDISYFSPSTGSISPSLTASDTAARGNLVDACGAQVPVLGCVARFHPMKGLATLLEAHRAMQATQPCELVLAGSGMTQDNAALTSLIAHVGCSERVTLLGLVDDVAALYKQFSALVLPSYFGEGTPNVVLEAMASGVPVVATRVGDAPRCVGRDEWLVEPGDADALRERILALLTLDSQQRDELIAANTRHIQASYSLDICHERYFALYRDLHTQAAKQASGGVAQ